MRQIKTYGRITILKKLFKDIEKLFHFGKGYIPLNMTLALAKDLKRKGLTK